MIRVVIADDEELVRSGLAALVGSEPDLAVVGEARDGREAVELVRRTRPDVVCMDIRMPTLDGIEATRQIALDPRVAGSRVLIITTFDEDAHVFEALRRGACGFLLKDTPPDQLLAAIRIVAQGEALLSPSVTRRLIERFGQQPAPRPTAPLESLTERELEVLLTVAQGLSNIEISHRLNMSYATAKTHVSRLLMKLDARDRAQLVITAYESGLVTPGTQRPGPGQV